MATRDLGAVIAAAGLLELLGLDLKGLLHIGRLPARFWTNGVLGKRAPGTPFSQIGSPVTCVLCLTWEKSTTGTEFDRKSHL